MSELKPCPFCGSDDIHIEQNGNFFWCECYICGATSREHHTLPEVSVLQCEDQAGRYWNNRPIESALQQKYDTLILEIKKAEEKIQEEDTKAVALYRERDSAGFSTAYVEGLIGGLEIATKIINELLEEK